MNGNQISKIKRLIGILGGIAFLLSLPLIAMQFTDEVQWSALDFIAAAVLLLALGLTTELIVRHVKTKKFRTAALLLLFLVFLFVWAELAVGIIGTPLGGH